MFFNRSRMTTVSVCIVGLSLLGACGGSDSESSDSTTQDTTASATDTTVVDETALLAAFCKAATDESINSSELDDNAQIEEVAAQMKTRAEALTKLAATSPADISADVTAVAEAATAMSDSLESDPTLENFNEVVTQFATAEVETASQKIDDFVAKNCEG